MGDQIHRQWSIAHRVCHMHSILWGSHAYNTNEETLLRLVRNKYDTGIYQSNEEMCKVMEENGMVTCPRVRAALRQCDRGCFLSIASCDPMVKYIDQPVEVEHLVAIMHSPSVYASSLQALSANLFNGAAFLNIGSATGYLSYVVSMLIGKKSINHSVEPSESLKSLAKRNVATMDKLLNRSTNIEFETGNGLLVTGSQTYDAIFVGTEIEWKDAEEKLCCLLKVGGAMVLPIDGKAMLVTRESKSMFSRQRVQCQKIPNYESECFKSNKRVCFGPWSPLTNATFPPSFQEGVEFCLSLTSQNTRCVLPREIFCEIFTYLPKDAFEVESTDAPLLKTASIGTPSPKIGPNHYMSAITKMWTLQFLKS